MTPTPEEVAALVKLLQRPYGNMTGSERTDTAAALTALQARVRELEAVLAYYASDAAWTVDQVEGPYGDYGSKARAALTTPPADSQ